MSGAAVCLVKNAATIKSAAKIAIKYRSRPTQPTTNAAATNPKKSESGRASSYQEPVGT